MGPLVIGSFLVYSMRCAGTYGLKGTDASSVMKVDRLQQSPSKSLSQLWNGLLLMEKLRKIKEHSGLRTGFDGWSSTP
ncbi:unnamed protein product [Linum trigynum]|uniref:Uncharacterized protein n=1 Tax=Linum trigynum TaxID=586398 RepID=A0AAV2DW55_9ROSI